MNDFFRSKTFKIIAVLLAAVLAFFLRAVYTLSLIHISEPTRPY